MTAFCYRYGNSHSWFTLKEGQHMRMKKLLALAMSAVMVLGSLTGCGSSKSSSSGKADSINILVWEGTWSEDAFKDFTKKTGIKVNVSYIDNTDTITS